MRLKVSQVVGPDLATRNGCDNLFLLLEQNPDDEVILDFSDVASISRSFAHEYLMKKIASAKTISEASVPHVVSRMFEFVKNQNTKKKQVENDNTKIVTLL
ncbi:MAG: STAS-like domain-containing protein [Thermoplasmataceae archaeon]